jgi:lipopolysaccharide biosynthesis protein
MSNDLRAISLFLPQFHPFPENDNWHGKGFTEWTNATKARPLFKNHYQPHLPSDLGFYDLRLNEIHVQQAELARQHGIYGFCHYHCWFTGKTLMERPVEDMLKLGKPDFPFCLCWTNENWTRKWDGGNREVLIEQKYSDEDDLNHIHYLLPFFGDRRYIRIDGKPVFLVYRTEMIPNIKRSAEIWRKEAIKAGIGDLYLIRVEAFETNIDPKSIGFDAACEFQPNWHNMPMYELDTQWNILLHKLKIKKSAFIENKIWKYENIANQAINHSKSADYKRYWGITPQWDNTARRKGDAIIFHDSTPEKYENWLRHITENFKPYSKDENIFFINAWNEWAEGNHLEPCQKWGSKYLEATANVLLKK